MCVKCIEQEEDEEDKKMLTLFSSYGIRPAVASVALIHPSKQQLRWLHCILGRLGCKLFTEYSPAA